MVPDLETVIAFAVTASACLASAVIDVRSHRIPNRITFPAMLALLAVHGIGSGLPGLSDAALGMLGGFLILLVPHLLGVLGAGDVKLMAVVGAGLGSASLLTVFAFTSLAGGAQILVWRAWLVLSRGRSGHGYRICYGPAIAAGAIGAMVLVLCGEPYLSFDFSNFF